MAKKKADKASDDRKARTKATVKKTKKAKADQVKRAGPGKGGEPCPPA